MVYHHFAWFGGHRYCSSKNKFLVFHVIKKDYKIKGSVNSQTLKVSHHPARFGGHKHCSSGDIMVLVCHMIWHDNVTKGWSTVRVVAA